MSNTPIYDELKRMDDTLEAWAQVDPRYFAKVIGEFPAEQTSPKNWIPAKRVENWGRFPIEWSIPVIPAPESAWKTFLRCLGWWKP